MIAELKKSPWWVKVILGLIALLVVVWIVGAIAGSDEDDESENVRGPSTLEAETKLESNVSTEPPATATAIPATIPPTPVPPPRPISLSGVGQFVTDKFAPPSAVSRLRLTHNGGSNFVVWAYGDQGQQDLLVNTIGSYSGSRPLISEGTWFLEIDADGAWTATIEAIETEQAAAAGLTGTGDVVSGLFDPVDTGPAPVEITHNGSSNFIVWLHCSGGSELVQNEIGPVGGSTVVDFHDGPCVWEVQSEGSWSVGLR